ncbi:MAG: 3-phosphoserine/phosphohydroxythreonine transaminase [Thermodesulfobacteriota bacterium]|nr:3-phosphoserine/phosphohydroxythreonine transaminase [Thermodesulfobacteriota bacterium]
MSDRIHNFNPGPAALPLPVLEEIQAEFLNFKGTGMSVTEISHRSSSFEDVLSDAVARVKRLLSLSDDFHVLFLQGGASTQFYMVPMNFLSSGATADYVNTGTWSTKAVKEAKILNQNIRVVASSEDRNFCYIPKKIDFSPGAIYAHLTSNNTIKGTQWAEFPDTGGIPLVADMSSDIMSRPLDVSPFGLIYAGAQKNLGPAGVTLAILRRDLLDRVREGLPSMISYQTFVNKNSLYNTPPAFAIYVVQLVLKWLEETMGGLEAMGRLNEQKAALLYDLLDSEDFYSPTADKDSRSMMNVTFRLPTVDLEKEFVAESLNQGMGGLKGHRSVGGCRASIYNPTSLETVQDLVSFMKEFVRTRG